MKSIIEDWNSYLNDIDSLKLIKDSPESIERIWRLIGDKSPKQVELILDKYKYDINKTEYSSSLFLSFIAQYGSESLNSSTAAKFENQGLENYLRVFDICEISLKRAEKWKLDAPEFDRYLKLKNVQDRMMAILERDCNAINFLFFITCLNTKNKKRAKELFLANKDPEKYTDISLSRLMYIFPAENKRYLECKPYDSSFAKKLKMKEKADSEKSIRNISHISLFSLRN